MPTTPALPGTLQLKSTESRLLKGSLATAAIACSIFALPASATWQPTWLAPAAWYGALAVFLGELVGFTEISSRYRDEPVRATFSRLGIAYMAINGAVAAAAFVLLRAYGDQIMPVAANPPLVTALAAGLGAMVVFRSKFFNFRTDDGKDVSVGLDIILSAILRVVDRKIDRLRAARRERLVFDWARRIADLMPAGSDFDRPNSFVTVSLASFQNLTTEEKQAIVDKTEELKVKLKDQPVLLKAMVLGFVVLNVAGEETFDSLMQDLERYLQPPAAPASPLPAAPPAPPLPPPTR